MRAVILACITLCWLTAISAVADAYYRASQTITALEDSIATFRLEGRFDEAAALAREVLVVVQRDPDARAYQIEDAERLVEFLEYVSGLPDSLQNELRHVEELKTEVEPLLGAQVSLDAPSTSPDAIPSLEDILNVQLAILGPDHPELIWTHEKISGGYYNADKPKDHKYHEFRAYDLAERILGMNHPRTGVLLGLCASTLWLHGEEARSELYRLRSVDILHKTVGSHHPETIAGMRVVAHIHGRRGDRAFQLRILEENIALAREGGATMIPTLGEYLGNTAWIYRARGDFDKAEAYWTESYELKQQARLEWNSGWGSLMELGRTRRMRGDNEGAQEYFERSLDLLGEESKLVGDRVTRLVRFRARVLHVAQRYDEAERYYRAIVPHTRVLHANSPITIDEELQRLGEILQAKGDFSGALAVFEEATELFERGIEGISFDDLRRNSRLSLLESPLDKLALSYLRTGDEARAWQWTEKNRGVLLHDLLTNRPPMTPDERARERTLRTRIRNLRDVIDATGLQGFTASRPDSLGDLIRSAEAELAEFQAYRDEKYPRAPIGTPSLDGVQKHLRPHEGIVGWLDVGPHHYIYLVRAEGPVVWEHLVLDTTEVLRFAPPRTEAASKLLRLLAQPPFDAQSYAAHACQINRVRFAPIETHVVALEHLFIIPSGPMVGIPVEALVTSDGSYIVERWGISYIPSASSLAILSGDRTGDRTHSLFALGDPPFSISQAEAMDRNDTVVEVDWYVQNADRDDLLRGAMAGNRDATSQLERLGATRTEVQSIADLFEDTQLLLGRDANEATVQSLVDAEALMKYRYMHIATHAIADDESGTRSALILSQVDLPDRYSRSVIEGTERLVDGRVTIEDILREWRLDADLVTLSACETAIGYRTKEDGHVGFAHALFAAGARSVVVSLWKVGDDPTRRLMTRFYENMIERDMPKSAALREAKLWLRDYETRDGETPYAHPAYWSAFVLIGDPG